MKKVDKSSSAGTADEQRTEADNSTSASLLPNPVLSAALSVEEGNILIAEFMGYVYLPDGKINGIKGILVHEDKMSMHLDVTKQFHAKYHSTWDWLMPVVEKIEKDISKEPYYGFTVRMADRCCLIACHERNKQDGVIYQTPWGFRPLLKIQAVWLAVVEFIKWYNNTAAVGSR